MTSRISPVATGGFLVGLVPPNKAPSLAKLEYETV